MLLDRKSCERARRTRDHRFDGRFFTGVLSTGIFCRPICPAPQPKEENVIYFPTSAAAAEAGLRPCLRCRPEAAPGTPAWLGTSATVGRALKLIGDGVLDEGSIAKLSDRLGISSRHLRRLFEEHLGASPQRVNQMRRLLFAKKLLSETGLPINQIALASGFNSVRRFNDSFKTCYGRAPGELRRGKVPAETGAFTLPLAYRPPFDWASMLVFLRLRAVPGLEIVDENSYRRAISHNDKIGTIRVTQEARGAALLLRLIFPDPSSLLPIVERVRRMFDLDADSTAIDGHLGRDPLLAQRVSARPGLRVPGAWNGFELAVRAVLGQQVSVGAARTLAARLVQRFGQPLDFAVPDGPSHLFPEPAVLAEEDLTVIGLTRSRAATLSRMAAAIVSGEIDFSGEQDLATFEKKWTAIKGIGPWTAQYVAMRAFNQPDAFPAADLGLLKAASEAPNRITPRELTALAEAWRPWRAYAVLHLWTG